MSIPVLREVEGDRRWADFKEVLAAARLPVPAGDFEDHAADGTRIFVGYADGRPVSVSVDLSHITLEATP
jgi:hypothetical protein